MPKKEVVLCKGIVDGKDTHNDYIEIFQSNGFVCTHLPTLRFEFVNIERLKNCLRLPNSYGGLILTSRRSVEAIGLALEKDENNYLIENWINLPAYCVGSSTASLAKNILKLKNCLGSECGNATELSKFIVDKKFKYNRPLLYPCSSIARDTIERILFENDINIEKIEVYDTLPVETLGNDLKLVINDTPKIFIFFSPSAVEYILNAAKEQNLLLKNILAVAIGPTTADALVNTELTVHAISRKPEPNSLLEAIQAAKL